MSAALLTGRWIAIAIAILGAIDPAVTSMRRAKPAIAVVALDRRDSTLARRVAEVLDDDYTVVRGPFAGAAATVIVGDALPVQMPAGVVFGVREDSPLSIFAVRVPKVTTTEARIPVVITGLTRPEAPVQVELLANGVVVDRVTTSRRGFPVTLTATPATTGPLVLQARAFVGRDTAVAEAVTDVVDAPRPVLFFDRRPSWMSTFVRRALERDRRFAVASRVITSRDISTEAGQPPSSLSDPTVLELYDVIVVGAPASLTAADVSGLETFLRIRGGIVVLLFDERPTGGIYDRLTGASRWTGISLRTPIDAAGEADGGKLRMTELAWPAMPPGESVARLQARVNRDNRPVVWSTMVGRGEVIVNGALDAWKFRDVSTSRFDEFWQATISRAASEAMAAIGVQLSQNLVEPRDEIVVKVITRDSSAVGEVMLVSDSASIPVRVWPTASRRGEFEGRFTAPASVGAFAVRATAGGARGERRFVVQTVVERPASPDWRAIETLATSTGGAVTGIDGIEGLVRGKVVAESRRERWWPMRSVWWLLPFVGLLGVEWFLRRRRGLA
ncbi:MAG: hypothetical protein ABIR92_12040 [Gemmatimonadaceae bacterium]